MKNKNKDRTLDVLNYLMDEGYTPPKNAATELGNPIMQIDDEGNPIVKSKKQELATTELGNPIMQIDDDGNPIVKKSESPADKKKRLKGLQELAAYEVGNPPTDDGFEEDGYLMTDKKGKTTYGV